MRGMIRIVLVAVCSSLITAAATPAAGPAIGEWNLAVYAGQYSPGPDEIDDELTYGLRLGMMATENWGVAMSLGVMSIDSDFKSDDIRGEIDGDFTFVDVDALYAIGGPDRRLHLVVGAGVGWAFASVDGTVRTRLPALRDVKERDAEFTFRGADADSFTANVVLGPAYSFSDKFSIRLQNRWRWFEQRDDDEIDRELTLAAIFAFGG
ncbi:MAG: outer membrane beta-barrel protein [Acidobacteria bacterium]|nr:outer membrane beta-barrel protein [Acidobacteriota bacterium]